MSQNIESSGDLKPHTNKHLLHSKINDFSKRVNLDDLYSTICLASPKNRINSANSVPINESTSKKKSLLQMAFGKASETKQSILYGKFDSIPLNWGVNGTYCKHWSEVTSTLLYEPLRMDIGTLSSIVQSNKLLSSDDESLKRLLKWLKLFKFHLELTLKLKSFIEEERIMLGFKYRVNTDYSAVWAIMHNLFGGIESILKHILHNSESKNLSLLDRGDCLNEISLHLGELSKELEACIREDETMIATFLKDEFTEENEHEALLEAIGRLNMPSDAIVIYKITNAMYHWLGNLGRTTFRKSLSGKLRCILYCVSSREYREYTYLLKSVYEVQHCAYKPRKIESLQSSGPSLRAATVISTPKGEPTSSKYVAMAV